MGIRDFRACLDDCGLRDVGFRGNKLTWDHEKGGAQNLLERLDQIVANDDWIDLFPRHVVANLDFWGFDHRVVLISTQIVGLNKSVFKLM